MGVVPHGACTGDDEDGHGTDEGTDPQCEEDEDVEADHAVIRVAGDGAEVCAGVRGEIGAGDQVNHHYNASCPYTTCNYGLDNWDQDGSADSSYELSGSLTDSHCQSQPRAAAKDNDEEEAAKADADPSIDGI